MNAKAYERARIDAKVNNTYIIYDKNGVLVKEYPNGKTILFHNVLNLDAHASANTLCDCRQ